MTRDQVVDAASEIVRRDGYESLTIRGLADAMGVSHMAIYRHVTDKDDVLFEVADRLLAKAWRPRSARRSNWTAWLTEMAVRFRRLMQREPVVLYAVLTHPMAMQPEGRKARDTCVEVVEASSHDPDTSWRIVGAVLSYTIGFTAIEAARASWLVRHPEQREAIDRLGTIIEPPNPPRPGADDQFGYGLKMLLDGVPTT